MGNMARSSGTTSGALGDHCPILISQLPYLHRRLMLSINST